MAFWGVEIKPEKSYTHRYDSEHGRLRISQATLGIGKSTNKSSLQCKVGNKRPILLCNLIPNVSETCSLELEFEEDEEVVFSVIGKTSVHLSGYYLNGAMDGDDFDSFGEDISAYDSSENSGSYNEENEEDEYDAEFINDSDEEMETFSPSQHKSSVIIEEIKEDENLSNEKAVKKNQQGISDDANEKKLVASNGSAVPESEDEDGFPVSSVTTKKEEEETAEAEKSCEKSSEKTPVESNEGEKDNDGTENATTDGLDDKAKKKKKKSKKAKVAEVVANESVEIAKDVKDIKEANDVKVIKEANDTMDQDQIKVTDSTPAEETLDKQKKKSKKSKKAKVAEVVANESVEIAKDVKDIKGTNDVKDIKEANDTVDQDQIKVTDPMPAEETSGKQKKKSKKKRAKEDKDSNEDGGKAVEVNESDAKKIRKEDANNSKDLTPNSEQGESTKVSKSGLKTRTFANGLVIEEIAMGEPDGKRAIPGRKVSVKYTGKLLNTGEIFDSNVGKKPFQFRLGIGQVIKGWDVGVNGMRVGDKRKLTIPPSYAYGEEKTGPIPANSWLTFDVELVSVQ